MFVNGLYAFLLINVMNFANSGPYTVNQYIFRFWSRDVVYEMVGTINSRLENAQNAISTSTISIR